MLRLLLVDDSPADRLLISREINREFSEVQIEPIIDAACLEQALTKGSFDLVITDYALQWSDGLTVLKQIKSRFPDCPVIMFTDSGSQEIAVEAMKAGLEDYILKSAHQYVRLPRVIHAALRRVQRAAEHKQTEAALQQSEERLRLALSAAVMGIWDWDIQTNQTTWTESTEKLFGLAPGTFGKTYKAFLDCVHPDDRDQIQWAVERSLAQKTGYSQEYRIVHPDGSIHWIASKAELICDASGQPLRMLGTNVDITQHKQTELALQKLNDTLEQQVQERTARLQQAHEFDETLKRITDKVRDTLDEDQILQTAVKELALAIGVNSCNVGVYDLKQGISTVRYEYTISLLSLQGRVLYMANFPEGYEQLLQGCYSQHCSLRPHPQRGRTAMLSCPIWDREEVMGDLWLIHNADYVFSEQEIRLVQHVATQCAIGLRQARLYQAAQTQVQELEKLNLLKDDFLSTVSHELRTPVANMKMAIQMLKLATTDDRRQRYLSILQRECDREADLVADLLDLQCLEESLSSKAIVDDVLKLTHWLPKLVEPFQTRAQERQQHLELKIPSDLPTLAVDRKRLDRILAELLNNACKYTPTNGKIVFSIHSELLTSAAASATVVFTIGNEAEIPASELPHIFKKFYRIPNADPWKQGGTGLGLALVQKLAEQLGGSIQVESHENWTTFTLKLQSCL